MLRIVHGLLYDFFATDVVGSMDTGDVIEKYDTARNAARA